VNHSDQFVANMTKTLLTYALGRGVETFVSALEAEVAGRDVGRELPAGRVVCLDRLVVAHALHGNAVLGAGQFVHQPGERGVGFQGRVVLHHHQQPGQGRGLLVGCGHLLVRGGRAGQLGPRVGNSLEDALFLRRKPLGGLHQVRNQVVAPLELVFNLRPLRLDGLFLAHELVVRTARRGNSRTDEGHNHEHSLQTLHSYLSIRSRETGDQEFRRTTR